MSGVLRGGQDGVIDVLGAGADEHQARRQLLENDPVYDSWPVTAQRVKFLKWRDERFELAPQGSMIEDGSAGTGKFLCIDRELCMLYRDEEFPVSDRSDTLESGIETTRPYPRNLLRDRVGLLYQLGAAPV